MPREAIVPSQRTPTTLHPDERKSHCFPIFLRPQPSIDRAYNNVSNILPGALLRSISFYFILFPQIPEISERQVS